MRLGIQADRGTLRPDLAPAASLTCWRNSCLRVAGNSRKSRIMDSSKILGLPLSKRAPASKSAQIISRQYPRALSDPSIRAAVSIACSITGAWLL